MTVTAPQPTWAAIPFRCAACGHAWHDWAPSGVSVRQLVGYLQAVRCCNCVSDRLLLDIGLAGDSKRAARE